MEGGSQVTPGDEDEDEERDLNQQDKGESELINTKVEADQAILSI